MTLLLWICIFMYFYCKVYCILFLMSIFRRFDKLKSRDPQFKERFENLGKLPGKTEFNWDEVLEDTTVSFNT